MCEFIINGGRQLNGEFCVQGSKNAVLPILAAAVLTDEECFIHNCPDISDVWAAFDILKSLGCRAELLEGTARVCAKGVSSAVISKELMQRMRSSVMFMGAMLSRGGEVLLYRPGGCRLGERPIDIHINSLVRLGAEINESGGCIKCRLGRAVSGDITLIYPSVGATENIMLMCAASDCDVQIFNPAREPEITELQNFLNLMGADIRGAGTDVIKIRKRNYLHGAEYEVSPDRIAAVTYGCMAAICGGRVVIKNAIAEQMRIPLAVLREIGCEISTGDFGVCVKSEGRLSAINSIKTLPYPGFPTDDQPMVSAVLAMANGVSHIDETIFENRFSYVPELKKMGADIAESSCSIEIRGVEKLNGGYIAAKDLRGGAALITAGLAARGETVISGAEYIDRGYEKIENVLTQLGANIIRREKLKDR